MRTDFPLSSFPEWTFCQAANSLTWIRLLSPGGAEEGSSLALWSPLTQKRGPRPWLPLPLWHPKIKCSIKTNPHNRRNQITYFESDKIFLPQTGKPLLIGKTETQALNSTSNLTYCWEAWKYTHAQKGSKMPSEIHKSGKYQASRQLIFNECYSWPHSSTALYCQRYLEGKHLGCVKNECRVCQCQCIIGQIKARWGGWWAVIC